jgi:hypothetical protein
MGMALRFAWCAGMSDSHELMSFVEENGVWTGIPVEPAIRRIRRPASQVELTGVTTLVELPVPEEK